LSFTDETIVKTIPIITDPRKRLKTLFCAARPLGAMKQSRKTLMTQL